MMDDKKKPGIMSQGKIEELSDGELSQVNGGTTIPTFPGSNRPGGLKLGQALKPNTSFSKSDDRLP